LLSFFLFEIFEFVVNRSFLSLLLLQSSLFSHLLLLSLLDLFFRGTILGNLLLNFVDFLLNLRILLLDLNKLYFLLLPRFSIFFELAAKVCYLLF